jgi:hypothetical protein
MRPSCWTASALLWLLQLPKLSTRHPHKAYKHYGAIDEVNEPLLNYELINDTNESLPPATKTTKWQLQVLRYAPKTAMLSPRLLLQNSLKCRIEEMTGKCLEDSPLVWVGTGGEKSVSYKLNARSIFLARWEGFHLWENAGDRNHSDT